jgi:hypothetical protein
LAGAARDRYPASVTQPPRTARRFVGAAALALLASSCASLEFRRETETSGTFTSTGTAVTFLAWDLPKGAVLIARENANDARQPNLEVTSERVFPDLGWFNWLLDIVGVRYARITGTWGFPPEPPAGPADAAPR